MPTYAIYKPDSQSTDEFIVILQDASLAQKWIGGGEQRFSSLSDCGDFDPVTTIADSFLSSPRDPPDRTIALVEFVDSFDCFHSGQGSQGVLGRPSKQELETVFGTTNDTEIVEFVLTNGKIQTKEAPMRVTGDKNSAGAHSNSRGAVGGGR